MYKINKQDGTIAVVTTWDDDAEFKDMHKAFLLLGFSEVQRNELYTLLSFSMSCGNIEFEENDKSESKVASFDELEKSAGLIQAGRPHTPSATPRAPHPEAHAPPLSPEYLSGQTAARSHEPTSAARPCHPPASAIRL